MAHREVGGLEQRSDLGEHRAVVVVEAASAVGLGLADHRAVAEHLAAEGQRGGRLAVQACVGTRATAAPVRAVAARQRVVARTAPETVVAAPAVQPIVASAAVELVPATVAAHDVGAGATRHPVPTPAAVQPVQPPSAADLVVARTAGDEVVAGPGPDDVVAAQPADEVVAAPTADAVGAGGAHDHVVARRAARGLARHRHDGGRLPEAGGLLGRAHARHHGQRGQDRHDGNQLAPTATQHGPPPERAGDLRRSPRAPFVTHRSAAPARGLSAGRCPRTPGPGSEPERRCTWARSRSTPGSGSCPPRARRRWSCSR